MGSRDRMQYGRFGRGKRRAGRALWSVMAGPAIGVGLLLGLTGCLRAPDRQVRDDSDQSKTRPDGASADVPRRSASLAGSLHAALNSPQSKPASTMATGSSPHFTDVHAEQGVEFVYRNGAIGKALMVESTGGGAGWLDYDRDGEWDLYLVQGGNPAWTSPDENPSDVLYRRVGPEGWVDVTEKAGIRETGYGQGVAIADYDNDGFPDIYVTNVGRNSFYRNMGDGTFLEAAEAAGLLESRWSTSAAWGDLDLDGDLDLYVCTYLEFDPYHPLPCFKANGQPTTCHPGEVAPVPDVCFENLGDGTFREVSKAWGLVGEGSKSLGVVIADLNDDGRPDVFVSNDTTANFLFINQSKGKFEERGIPLGCALSGDGLFQANMGIAFGDFDENGHPDLYVTHFTNDYNTLYANLGKAGFQDVTHAQGLVEPTLKYLGFGTVMADFDRNGRADLFVANGHIDDYRDIGLLFYMRPQAFTYLGGRWRECTDEAGDYFRGEYLGRAVATCDYDHDGDLDLAVIHQNAPMAILRNDATAGHWLAVRFIGTSSNREGWQNRVTLRQGRRTMVQQLAGGTSYCASHQPQLLFALTSAEPCDLEVLWTSGIRQRLQAVGVDQLLILQEPARSGTADP